MWMEICELGEWPVQTTQTIFSQNISNRHFMKNMLNIYTLYITQEKRPHKNTFTSCVLRLTPWNDYPTIIPKTRKRSHAHTNKESRTMDDQNTQRALPPAFLDLLPQRSTLTKRQKKRHNDNNIGTLSTAYLLCPNNIWQRHTNLPTIINPPPRRWHRNQPTTIVLQRNASKLPHTNSSLRNRFQTNTNVNTITRTNTYNYNNTQHIDAPTPRFPELNPLIHKNIQHTKTKTVPQTRHIRHQRHTQPTPNTSHKQHVTHQVSHQHNVWYDIQAKPTFTEQTPHFKIGIQFPSMITLAHSPQNQNEIITCTSVPPAVKTCLTSEKHTSTKIQKWKACHHHQQHDGNPRSANCEFQKSTFTHYDYGNLT